ncbi:MAG TPA: serine hydrolase domain-containing protein, partial [Chloroflexota bacterium]|nr:serine hydrolase domain-containing protein [Chloroflexota bacterium]
MAIATPTRHTFLEAEPEEAGMSTSRLKNLSRVVQEATDQGSIPGGITMIARRGKTVHFETYGKMDVEAGRPTQPDTIYRFYSMTKPIASVGLMMLYEEGRFQLDDPASKYIPQFKGLKVFASGTADKYETREPARETTIRDLLTHTGGLTARGGAPGGT